MKPSAAQTETLRKLSRQFPEFVEFVDEWRGKELEALPYAKDNLNVQQGRVQALSELQRFLSLDV
jgi:hypothetical protein